MVKHVVIRGVLFQLERRPDGWWFYKSGDVVSSGPYPSESEAMAYMDIAAQ